MNFLRCLIEFRTYKFKFISLPFKNVRNISLFIICERYCDSCSLVKYFLAKQASIPPYISVQ